MGLPQPLLPARMRECSVPCALERGGGGPAHLYSVYAISVRWASVICTWWDIMYVCASGLSECFTTAALSWQVTRYMLPVRTCVHRGDNRRFGVHDQHRAGPSLLPGQDSRWAPHSGRGDTAQTQRYNPQNKSRRRTSTITLRPTVLSKRQALCVGCQHISLCRLRELLLVPRWAQAGEERRGRRSTW